MTPGHTDDRSTSPPTEWLTIIRVSAVLGQDPFASIGGRARLIEMEHCALVAVLGAFVGRLDGDPGPAGAAVAARGA
jgi:hypothetical protein